MKSMAATYQTNRRSNSLTAQLGATEIDDKDNNDDNASQLLLSQDEISDFLRGA